MRNKDFWHRVFDFVFMIVFNTMRVISSTRKGSKIRELNKITRAI